MFYGIVFVVIAALIGGGIAYKKYISKTISTALAATANDNTPFKVVRTERVTRLPKAVRRVNHRMLVHPTKYSSSAKVTAIRQLAKVDDSKIYKFRTDAVKILRAATSNPANGREVRRAAEALLGDLKVA